MNASPLLAVIVPVYKVEDYLRECIDSILSQSYTSLRVILVDDGSPDRSGEICEEYARQDPRVIVVHKENGGQSTARNRGLELAKDATYITFVDSDDYIEPDIYKAAISFLEEHQEVDIVGFGINELRTEGKVYCGESVGRLYSREEAFPLNLAHPYGLKFSGRKQLAPYVSEKAMYTRTTASCLKSSTRLSLTTYFLLQDTTIGWGEMALRLGYSVSVCPTSSIT